MAEQEAFLPKTETLSRKTIDVQGNPWQYVEHGNPNGIPILTTGNGYGDLPLAQSFTGEFVNSQGIQEITATHPKTAAEIHRRLQQLHNKYHIITPELPGWGRTPPLPDFTYDNLADDMYAFQQAIGQERAIVVGESLSGITAIKLAARHPDSTRLLVLQGAITKAEDMKKHIYLLKELGTKGLLGKTISNPRFRKTIAQIGLMFSKDYLHGNAEVRQKTLDTLGPEDQQTFLRVYRGIGEDLEEDITNVQCPVLFIDGTEAEVVPIQRSSKAAQRFHKNTPPKERYPHKVVNLPIRGHGHNIINTFPEAVAVWVDDVAVKLKLI